MVFIVILLAIGLQFLHWRALRRLLPERWGKWIAWGMVLIHLPLLIYAGLRVAGASPSDSVLPIRSLARGGLYFLVLSVFNLIILSLETLLWRIRKHRGRDVDHDRRAFLQKGAAVSLGFLAIVAGKGYREGHGTPEIRRETLGFPDLPSAFDGLRIAHLSDLHAGPLASADQLRLWRAMAERENRIS